MFDATDQLGVNTVRTLSIDMIDKANSGHPGLPLGAAPMAYTLYTKHLKQTPKDSKWPNRDRFVLSAGHGSAMLYSLLHLAGYDLSISDLKNFRQFGSKTPGHPEVTDTHGVEATTGPLGQGFANAVGMAMAEAHQAALYNKEGYNVIDHYTYALVGDGCLMEGISYEAASLAGRLELNKLIVLYDSNDISLDGDLSMAFNEDVKKRFEAQNWNYIRVENGNNLEEISNAIEEAKKSETKPTLIEVKTTIGYASPKAGTSASHGAPLGEEGSKVTKKNLGWEYEETFYVPEEVKERFSQVKDSNDKELAEWEELFENYKKDYPELADQFEKAYNNELPEDLYDKLPKYEVGEDAKASRAYSSEMIQVLGEELPHFWGGSADLSSSNNTMNKAESDFLPGNYEGRNIWYGVREFAMGAIQNGIVLHGGSIAYTGTFFVFSDYIRPAIRVAALSELPTVYVFTHDSVAVGEDGPTHQPVEQLASFRAMPNMNVIRPADGNETAAAWYVAASSKKTPTILALTRQGLPVLEGTKEKALEGVKRGAYVLSEAKGEKADGILIASGSEVNLAVSVQEELAKDGIDVSVVSVPNMNSFLRQDKAYQEEVLPKDVTNRMAIEMASPLGWDKFTGTDGYVYAIEDKFGTSAPAADVLEDYGFTTEKIVAKYKELFA